MLDTGQTRTLRYLHVQQSFALTHTHVSGRLSARGKSVNYSKLVAGAGLALLPGEQEDVKKKTQKKPATSVAFAKKPSTPRGGGVSNLPPLSIALTLCDSLRDAAYQGILPHYLTRIYDACKQLD